MPSPFDRARTTAGAIRRHLTCMPRQLRLTWTRRSAGGRRTIAAVIVVALAAGGAAYVFDLPTLITDALGNRAPKLQEWGPPAEGRDGKVKHRRPRHAGSGKPATVRWPKAARATVPVPGKGRANVGGMPVAARPVNGKPGRPVVVETVGRKTSNAAGADGVLLKVSGQQKVRLSAGYRGFAAGYGGDYGTRLRLYRATGCEAGLTRGCATTLTPVKTVNDSEKRTVTATVDAPRGGAVYVIAAATDSTQGTYKATALSPSSSWTAGGSSGDFTWSYPFPTPATPSGLKPTLGLSYSSQSTDGKTATTNNQGSWIGEGFTFEPGYIERRYKPCSDDGQSTSGDLCWEWNNLTLMLDGRSGELVKDGTTWRLSSDDGSVIKQLKDTVNDDNTNEYWKLTTSDGTQYFFGLNRLPGWTTGDEETKSAWAVPVFGNEPGEPCNDTTFASSYCNQAWRWNLDYVIDTHDNVISYFYSKETNYYARNRGTDVNGVAYTRGGYLKKISYGERNNSVYSTLAPAWVSFAVSERCIPTGSITCDPAQLNDSTADHWPDVPWDRNCPANTKCDSTQISPTFWTRKRLTGITTNVRGATTNAVSSWKLDHTFVSNADTTRTLWLFKITRSGHYGSEHTMPSSTQLQSAQMANRIDVTGDSISPMIRPRLSAVFTDTGGTIDVAYSAEDCAPGNTPTPSSNTRRCFPVKWEPPSSSSTITDWFHKYVVTQVTVGDLVAESPPQVTQYKYPVDGAAWRKTKPDGLSKTSNLTWADWRGYQKVQVIGAPSTTLETRSDHTYFRGMDGDDNGAGGTRSVTITDTEGTVRTDHDELAGLELEAVTYNGADIVSKEITSQWRRENVVINHTWGGTQKAVYVRPSSHWVYTALEAGGFRKTTVTNRYDTTYGRVYETDDYGDSTTIADNTCTRTDYAQANTTKHILNLPSQVETVAARCDNTTVDRSTQIISDNRIYYDDLALGAAPTKGAVTKTKELDKYDPTNPVYVTTATTAYDTYGRVTSVANALDKATTTTYTDNTDLLNVKQVVTNPKGHTVTTTYDPAVGQPVTIVDANNKTTSLTYDPMGRLSAVWLPTRSKAGGQNPNLKFSYTVRADAPISVKAETIKNDGVSYRTSYELFDGWLRSRQTQTDTPGGRVVTDTIYDALGRTSQTNEPYTAAGAPGGALLVVPIGDTNGQTTNVYDKAGRVTAEVYSVAGVEKWRTAYAHGGDRVHTTPAAGGTATTVVKDARGNTTKLLQYHGPAPTGTFDTTDYTYTPRGELKSVVNQAGETWTYSYDQRGRKTGSVDPDTGTTSTTYDNLGRVKTTTDNRNVTLAYDYDDLDRQTALYKVVNPNDRTTWVRLADWSYDTAYKGRLDSSSSYDGDLTYTHAINWRDALYRPIRETHTLTGASAGALAGSYQFNPAYNLDNTLSGTTYPAAGGLNGEGIIYTYDDAGRVTQIAGDSVYAGDIRYYPTDVLAQVGMFAGAKDLWQTFEYERGTNRLTKSYVTDLDTGRLTNNTYTYDPAGNITSIIDDPTAAGGQRDAQCFRYDHLRRLKQAWTTTRTGDGATACGPDPTDATVGGPAAYWHDYEFHTNGNRKNVTIHATGSPGSPEQTTTSAYTYNTVDAEPGGPHAVKDITDSVNGTQVAKRSYTYDEAGNTKTRPAKSGTQTLGWNDRSLLATTTEGGNTTNYFYDAEGNRYLRRDADGGMTLYLPGMELRQPAGASTVTATRYCELPGGITYVRTPAGGQYQTSDHHGTATVALNPDSGQSTHRRFDPYGNTRGTPPLQDQWAGTKGFVGGTQDPTGFIHLGAREYEPATGRFISVDPLIDHDDPQQMNGYAYADNNPVTMTDPDGLQCTMSVDEVGAQCGNAPHDDSGNDNNDKPSGGDDKSPGTPCVGSWCETYLDSLIGPGPRPNRPPNVHYASPPPHSKRCKSKKSNICDLLKDPVEEDENDKQDRTARADEAPEGCYVGPSQPECPGPEKRRVDDPFEWGVVGVCVGLGGQVFGALGGGACLVADAHGGGVTTNFDVGAGPSIGVGGNVGVMYSSHGRLEDTEGKDPYVSGALGEGPQFVGQITTPSLRFGLGLGLALTPPALPIEAHGGVTHSSASRLWNW